MDLQQLPIPDQVADRYRLNAERLGLAPAAYPVPVALDLDKLGQAGDQLRDPTSLIIGQPLVRDGDGIPRSPYT